MMNCPHCQSKNTYKTPQATALGYDQFRCRACTSQFNGRTGTKLNHIEHRTEVVMIAVHYYYRFKASLDDVVELMVMRGFQLSHQTVHNWAHTFGVELGLKIRARRIGGIGKKWHMDITYIKVNGEDCYLYRAIDKEGNLVDVYLSDVRDEEAAEHFFTQAEHTAGITPEQITTDKEPALYPAIERVFGKKTKHRDSKYMNNCIEQHHRGVKSRYEVMKGFKNFIAALFFCTVFEEIQQFFRMPNKTRAQRRGTITSRIYEFHELLTKAA